MSTLSVDYWAVTFPGILSTDYWALTIAYTFLQTMESL